MSTDTPPRLTATDIEQLDPYAFMAVIGKRVIHPGGRRSTEELVQRAQFQPGQQVLDGGCGVGTTAIRIAQQFNLHVTAVDIAPLMQGRARQNVPAADSSDRVAIEHGDILALQFPDNTLDRVLAEAVTMFVERPRAAGVKPADTVNGTRNDKAND